MATRNKIEWTIRVIIPIEGMNELPLVWVEQLRYMGHAKQLAENTNRQVVEFYGPRGLSTDAIKTWSEHNVERMRSFGFNAVAAPKWNGHDKVDIDV